MRARAIVAIVWALGWLWCGPAVHGQDDSTAVPIRGDRLSGFVLPIEPIQSPVHFKALRGWAWTVDDTKRLVLHGDVGITLGGYAFAAKDAVVWINRIPSAQGVVNQIAVYFPRVDDPTKQAGLGAQGDQLLVTGSTRGEVTLNVTLLDEHAPRRGPLLKHAEERLASYLKSLLVQPPSLQSRPNVEPVKRATEFVPQPGGPIHEAAKETPATVVLPPVHGTGPWLASPQGSVRFSATNIEIARGEEENVITAIGGIVVEILSDRSDEATERLTLTAERAVIFADPGPLVSTDHQIDSKNVRGVYLEGNVTVSTHGGEYFVRAPQIYYDFRTQKAIMVDSLLRVQPRDFGLPVYARAREMQQVAANQWESQHAIVSTSEFATPHLAIGSRRAVITQRQTGPEDGPSRTVTNVDSEGNTLRVVGVPIFYWPQFSGDVEKIPLKRLEAGTRKNDGLRILTVWDFFTLSGMAPPQGVEAEVKVDTFTKRGAGAGFDLKYDVGASEGRVDLYGLYDTGTDRTSSGRDVDPDDEFRGVALFENQTQLTRAWSLQAQASIISDETFITSWREDDFAERREYETSLYLKHQRDNAAMTLLVKDSIQDFISNSYLLASRQYTVEKQPEFGYRRYGDSLFDDRITYSSETRLSRMAMSFVDATPRQLGVRPGAFGIGLDTPVSSTLLARGLHEDWVMRADSRHELSMPMHPGIFNVTPFVVGRATGYDDDFSTFSSDADSVRFFGAAGVRVSTEFQRVMNGVENQLFDLHRMRHLIEPYITLWSSYANVTQTDLPVYDEEVESIADGSAVQFGVRNTWQTQRGGPGRWRSVDWLSLDASIVIDSEGQPNESPTPQFFEYRPEYSMFGDHARARGVLLLSDNLSFAGDITYLLEDPIVARTSLGIELRHSPLLVTFIEYRYIQANLSELLEVGWDYQLTPKYKVAFGPQFDLRAEDFRSVSLRITRQFPDFDFILIVRHDQIRNDTLVGASMDLTKF